MALMLWIMMIVSSVAQYRVGGMREGPSLEMPPQILEEPKDEIVRKNDPLTLYCKATGTPPPAIVWYKADSETPLRDRDSRLQLPDGSLFFYRVRARDAGAYYCVAHSVAGTATSRRAALQMAYLRKDFRKWPSSLGVVEGETAVFECDPPKGHPTPIITWRLDGENLKLPRHRFRQEGTRLIVSHVVPGDEGEYQCVVTNMADQRVSHAATLTVYVSARVGGVVKSMVGVSGHGVTLPCVPSGNPEPQVMWRRADGLIPVGRSAVGRDWSLTIRDLVTEDQGRYVCEASNQAGSHSANTSLLVVESPRVDGGVRPRIAVITPTHVRKISCPVSATPPPLIFWVKENHPREEVANYPTRNSGEDEEEWAYPGGQPQILVGEESNVSGGSSEANVDSEHSLHVSSEQEGLWACMATNEVGGLMLPVHVVGGGVARGSVSIGIVGVDEVEARAALLTPTLEQGHPASTSSRTATLSWRLMGRPTHMEGIFVLGCRRGFGYLPLRVQQQLQTHDISRHRLNHNNVDTHRRIFPNHQDSSDGYKESGSQHQQKDQDDEEWKEILNSAPLNDMDPEAVPTTPWNASQQGTSTYEVPSEPKCSDLRILGYTLAQGKNTYVLEDLEPYTSYWLLLLPHYKGVLGVPSNMQAFTTPQDVPSGWVVLSRWWAARADDGFYALTLHWRPLPPHLSHGIITRYQVIVHESDTGITHNVSVVGDLTSLTLANVTSSRVSVTLSASTVKGQGPPSPPARLNLLMTHFKETSVGTGVMRSAWFMVLAGGAIAMVVMVVTCTVVARWCAGRIHTNIPSETSKNKMCGVVEPWTEVGGLWAAAVEVDHLNSDKSERKLLASTASSTADYAEVEDGTAKIKDEFTKNRLDAWSQGLLNSSPSPSRSSANTHRTNLMTQSYSRHTPGRTYTSSATHTTNNTSRDSNTDTWYTGECCSCCHDDIKLMVPSSDAFCSISSGRTTVLANPTRDNHTPYPKSVNYQYSEIGTDTYEAVTAYCETTHSDHGDDEGIHRPSPQRSPHQDPRQLRLNTESTTDLSMDAYNFSDEDDETQSCSDTEASFFIPHDHQRKGESSIGRDRKNTVDSSYEDIQRPIRDRLLSSSGMISEKIPSAFRRVIGEERSSKQERDEKGSSSLKGPNQNTDSGSTSGISSSSPLVVERCDSSSLRKMSSRSSVSQDSLEEQFERTLSMISQAGSCNLDSDYLSTSAYN